MTEQVISHRRARRKRGHAWAHLAALAVTAIALAAASWLAPYVYRPPPPIAPVKTALAPAPLKPPREALKDMGAEAAAAPTPAVEASPARRARRIAPAAIPDPNEGLEILSEAEMAAISQARY